MWLAVSLLWLSATGTGCFLAAIVGGPFEESAPINWCIYAGHTVFELRFAVLAISGMLGLGFVT